MKNPLLDQEFLHQLDLERNKTVYAKIILLTWDEEPVEEIQGRITQGSINIDGASAVRRTCSLTMVSEKADINNTYWALKNKFKLEVGVENTIDSQYPSIIWFKQGVYVFTSLNMNVQSNNFTISLSGKDKMCLLNGEVGGSINASTDFGKLEEYETLDNGEIIRNIIDIPIPDIIKNAIHAFAGEPMSNIVLNDIDNYGLELLEYRVKDSDDNEKPMFMLRNIDTHNVITMTFATTYKGCTEDGQSDKTYYFNDSFQYYNTTQGITELNTNADIVYVNVKDKIERYNVIKITYGMTAGYRRTKLTYPGELVANVGEALTSVLDKIKNMFSDFEYFYDVDGRFIFQKKKTYINTSFNNLKNSDNQIYAVDAAYTSATTYSFEDGVLISAFTDAPQILNIRNDFSIWGKRKSVLGVDLPVHMRYAIDSRPVYYKPIRFNEEDQQIDALPYVSLEYMSYKEIDLTEQDFEAYKYYVKSQNGIYTLENKYDSDQIYYEMQQDPSQEEEVIYCDWREIIYQMALDYFKYNHIKNNFIQLVAENNRDYYPTGITGYETYYTDMQGFWRQLYHPGVHNTDFISSSELKQLAREYWFGLKYAKPDINKTTEEDLEAYINSDEAKFGQIISLTKDEIVTIYYLSKNLDSSEKEKINVDTDITDNIINNIIEYNISDLQNILKEEYNLDCWNKNVSKAPEVLNFWFDFMDTQGEMGKYSVQAIGSRPKAVNNDKITSIYFQETPTVLFLSPGEKAYNDMIGYTYIQLTSSMENYFSISAQGKSAKDELDSLLYQHTYATENVNLTSMPIYHLQPNTRIYVKDDNTGISGEYIVSKITVPLQYNGTTAITTTKAVERIY